MIKREQKQKIYENNNFIEEKLRKEERLRKDKFLKTFKRDYIKVITNRFEENQIIDVDLCETTIEFLNKNYNQWDLGYFSYLISFLLKELNYEDDKLNRSLLSNNINESQRIILNNISVYSNYNVKELKKNHKKIIYKDINLKYTPIMEKNND